MVRVLSLFFKKLWSILHYIVLLPYIKLRSTSQNRERRRKMRSLESIKRLRRNPNAQFPGFTTPAEEKRFQENDVTEVNIKNILDRHSLSPSYALQELSEISDSTEVHNCYLDFISHLFIHVVKMRPVKNINLVYLELY